MKLSFVASVVYLTLGLASGLYYREITKAHHFVDTTQLSVLHTHLLVLGFLFFLIVLIVDKVFGIVRAQLFHWFFWIYNAGLLTTVTAMAIHGTLTLLGKNAGAALSGIAGMGHIMLTVGLIMFVIVLGQRVFTRQPGREPESR